MNIFRKEKFQNKGSVYILCIYSILLLTMNLGVIIIHDSTLSKQVIPFESLSRIIFDNWYYKLKLDKKYFSNLYFNFKVDNINIYKYPERVNINNSSGTFYMDLYYYIDDEGNIIFTERHMKHE